MSRPVTLLASAIAFCLAVPGLRTSARAAAGDARDPQQQAPRRTVSTDGIDVAQVVAEALERNPELLAAREELEIARGQMVKARYLNPFNPTLGAAAGNREFDGGGSEGQPSANLSLEVEVAGQRGKRIDAATRHLERIQADIDDKSRLLRARVGQAFYQAVYTRERQRLASEVENLTRRVSDASAKRFRAGEVPKMEPNISRIRYSQARKNLLTAERQHGDALRELERLLGREPRGVIVLRGELRVGGDTLVDLPSLVDRALRERPDLRAHSAEVERIEAELALTRRLAFPNLTFSAFYDEEAEADGARDRMIGAGVTIPLPLFDRQQGELVGLAAHRSQVLHQRQAAELTIRAEVEEAFHAYRTALESVRVYEADALDLIEESFRFTEVAYREGKIDLLELTVVQNDLVEARAAYLESLSEYWLSRIALERAIGASPFDDSTQDVPDAQRPKRR